MVILVAGVFHATSSIIILSCSHAVYSILTNDMRWPIHLMGIQWVIRVQNSMLIWLGVGGWVGGWRMAIVGCVIAKEIETRCTCTWWCEWVCHCQLERFLYDMTSSTDYLIYVVGTEVCYQLAKETGTDVVLHACMSVWVWTDKGVCAWNAWQWPNCHLWSKFLFIHQLLHHIVPTLSWFIEPEFVRTYQVYDNARQQAQNAVCI